MHALTPPTEREVHARDADSRSLCLPPPPGAARPRSLNGLSLSDPDPAVKALESITLLSFLAKRLDGARQV